jgi:hypothetical protein
MKTSKTTVIFGGLIAAALAVFVFSCNNPVGLGAKLDIEGPVVKFTLPAIRSAVKSEFVMEGEFTDLSGVDRMLLTAEYGRTPYPKQWRYSKRNGWEVSENSGVNWTALSGAEWNGTDKRSTWKIPVNMAVGDERTIDGEYLFILQAWDQSGFSDDNSFQTLVLIIDNNAPSVEISNPYLYSRFLRWNGSAFVPIPIQNNDSTLANAAELLGLHNAEEEARFDPNNIGKFLTQSFRLQWQIDDYSDISSMDLRFYRYDEDIDEDVSTPLSDDYIFSYKKDVDAPPEGVDSTIVKPNGSLQVPALHGSPANYVADGGIVHLKNPVTVRTTIKVVSVCYDAAGWVNEERIVGYFIYWEAAGEPWIVFTEGMKEPDVYYDKDLNEINRTLFMIYPGREVKPTAFQAHGAGAVTYKVYKCVEHNTGTQIAGEDVIILKAPPDGSEPVTTGSVTNTPRAGFLPSTIFPWSFTPEPRTGYYVVEAYAYGSKENASGNSEVDWDNRSALHSAVFRVQDISFPKFESLTPAASEPMFRNMENGKITIEGIVTDATEVMDIRMVWINPKSRDYAAMSQLQYYRDKDYNGWKQAKELQPGETAEEDPSVAEVYDTENRNRLWKLLFEEDGEDENRRRVFKFSLEIDLRTELGIGGGNALSSQMFLLRAENPDGKCDIITYAPQGDMLAPKIEIERVAITKRSGTPVPDAIPNEYSLIPQFENGDVITIHGKWEEDSTEYLAFDEYLRPNFVFSVNGESVTGSTAGVAIAHSPNYATNSKGRPGARDGTFTVTLTLAAGNALINTGLFRDTFMVNVAVTDIGGSPAEFGAAWLVAGDLLTFLRVTSDEADETYITGEEIEIYLEFSKPVMLNPNRTGDPVLILNSASGGTAVATYGRKPVGTLPAPPQNSENTKQYFVYKVLAGHNTTNTFLNVTGLQGVPSNDTGWTAGDYRFMWQHVQEGAQEGTYTTEYFRLTSNTNGTSANRGQPLPTSGIQSLISGKNIVIDTKPPAITSTTATIGRHGEGAEIFIAVKFDENVIIGTGTDLPTLTLGMRNNATATTESNVNNITVTRDTVRFRYLVKNGDDTGLDVLTIMSASGIITDLSGNPFTWSGGSRTLANVYLDTGTPVPPRIRLVPGSSTTPFSNIVGANTLTASTSTAGGADMVMGNIYSSTARIEVLGQGSYNTDYTSIEYSIDGGTNWTVQTVSANQAFRDSLPATGSYKFTARQRDAAGNVSPRTQIIDFNWDSGGNFITRIETSSSPGTYTRNTQRGNQTIPITVHFRKPVTFSGSPTLTLNARNTANGTGGTAATAPATSSVSAVSSVTFTYTIGATDNTAANTRLAVTALNLGGNVADAQTVQVNDLVTPLPASTDFGKNIYVLTGELNPSGNPSYTASGTAAQMMAADEWTGTIDITFPAARQISKGSETGATAKEITITQQITDYRIPAVLTEAQASRYSSAPGFSSFYTRGTNGVTGTTANGTTVDTATKFVLNYNQSSIVSPLGSTGTIGAMANYFLNNVEKVTLPLSSQNITIVNGNTLRISLTGSNALPVLGAVYDISIPEGFVVDIVDNPWPRAGGQTYVYTVPNVNRPFIRVDKKINMDRVVYNTGGGSSTQPTFNADFTSVWTTTARLDCRTPGSTIRYATIGQNFDTQGTNGTNTGVTSPPSQTSGENNRDSYTNTATAANNSNTLARPGTDLSTGGTTYDNSLLTVGDNSIHGFIWRITARSRSGNVSGQQFDEIAFRTVLTFELNQMQISNANVTNNVGQHFAGGDQVWIRGGDSSQGSSIPGFPLTYTDDFTNLRTIGERAGKRLLQRIDSGDYIATTNATVSGEAVTRSNASTWRWVTWEINVRTWYDMVMGRDNTNTANEVWQYGPRRWVFLRAGWTNFNDDYTLYPGKHRWLRVNGAPWTAGPVSWSAEFSTRPEGLSVTKNQPNP